MSASPSPIEITSALPSAEPAPPPLARIAKSWHGEALPLGLGDPLPLLGADALAPAGLPLHLLLDWAPALLEHVLAACLAQAAADRPWFSMPPACVTARPGTGRLVMARHLARCAGVPFGTLHLSHLAGASGLRSSGRWPDIMRPSAAVLMMALARCANPIILVTGLEAADDRCLEQLLGIIDPATSGRWTEPDLEAVIDFSHVSWIVQCSDTSGVPKKLAHLADINVDLAREDHDLRLLTIVSEVLKDLAPEMHAGNVSPMRLIEALTESRRKPASEIFARAAEELAVAARSRR